MRFWVQVTALVSLSAAVSGCSGFQHFVDTQRAPYPTQGAGRLVASAAVEPPAGLVALCASGELNCVLTLGAEGERGATGAAGFHFDRRENATQVFQALLTMQMQQNALPANERHVASAVERVALTETAWRQLVEANDSVNSAISPDTDEHIYGEDERWALPLTDASDGDRRRGDCEDFALEKRQRLLSLGFPAGALALAVAMAPGVGRHAVLVVRTERGDFVLDNLRETPMAIEQTHYAWLSFQSGADPLAWSLANLDVATRAGFDGLKGSNPGI